MHGVSVCRTFYTLGFLSLCTTDILGQIIICWRYGKLSFLHCRMFGSIPDFYPLDARGEYIFRSKGKWHWV